MEVAFVASSIYRGREKHLRDKDKIEKKLNFA